MFKRADAAFQQENELQRTAWQIDVKISVLLSVYFNNVLVWSTKTLFVVIVIIFVVFAKQPCCFAL